MSIVIEQPAPKFYITPYQAKMIILSHNNTDFHRGNHKSSLKKEMADDLIANYNRLREQFPHTPNEKIYEMVVEQPAKSFYISHRCARDVIFNYTGRNGK